eukprot:2247786-Prymnesium_polylepis.1
MRIGTAIRRLSELPVPGGSVSDRAGSRTSAAVPHGACTPAWRLYTRIGRRTVPIVASPIAGSVHLAAAREEWVGHKLGIGELFLLKVALGHSCGTADVNLAHFAERCEPPAVVEHVNRGVATWDTNGNTCAHRRFGLSGTRVVRKVGLGRAIEIVELRLHEQALCGGEKLWRERLAYHQGVVESWRARISVSVAGNPLAHR